MYTTRPDNNEELKTRVTNECSNITQTKVTKVQREIMDGLGYCQAQRELFSSNI